ncbi:hypothetical protein NL676_035167 [Syzygium grande]|nr:hypothetical protein NL676_035167 [Syzygium grande]
MLEKLEEIYGEDCNWLEMIPGDIGRLLSLKILKLIGTRVENVPELPQSLQSLCLSSRAVGKAPEISNLVGTSKYHRHKLLFGLPLLSKELELKNCKNLRHIGQLPSSLRKLTVENCCLLEVVDLSNLEKLLELTFHEQRFDIQCLEGLEGLTLLQRFRVLKFQCGKFSGLERLENLRLSHFEDSGSLETLPDLSNLKNLEDFTL